MKITTVWKQDHHFTSFQDKLSIEIDGSVKSGMSPKALLLSGVAGCSGIDVVEILSKMKIVFSEFTIDVEADQTTEHPRVFKDINITYKMKAGKKDEEKI